jgi:hypothetical protein
MCHLRLLDHQSITTLKFMFIGQLATVIGFWVSCKIVSLHGRITDFRAQAAPVSDPSCVSLEVYITTS